jgi:uncharacterized membrane protein (DUF373 family)
VHYFLVEISDTAFYSILAGAVLISLLPVIIVIYKTHKKERQARNWLKNQKK